MPNERELATRCGASLESGVIADGEILFALEEPESRPYADFYYWAPFVFLGA